MKSRSYPTVQAEPEWRESAAEPDLERIKRSVELVGRLSDGLIRIGPWGLGIDGVLAWIPGVGELYSALAGGFILIQGIRARVPLHILLAAAALLISRMGIDAVPIGGAVVADLFIAHKWAAKLVAGAIDKKLARRRR
ncbi:MAG TPA: DUF4112 domain-containing protein [Caulobacteraceae bacterium]|nr:DUF4112 domain-containing protein [Caulobacteraceae bacterium]